MFRRCATLAIHNFNLTKLFVRYPHHAHHAYVRREVTHALHVYICVFTAATVADIDGVLEHPETIAKQVFPKLGGGCPAVLIARGDVKRYHNPHDSVCA